MYVHMNVNMLVQLWFETGQAAGSQPETQTSYGRRITSIRFELRIDSYVACII